MVLDRFHAAVFGLGRVYGPISPRKGHLGKQPIYRFEVGAYGAAQAIVAALWKWLSPFKRAQVLRAFRTFHANRSRTIRRVAWGTATGVIIANHRKTHCVRGHPFDETNTYVRPSDHARICRECQRQHIAQYAARQTS